MAPKQKEEGKEGLSITIWAGGALRDVEETGRGAAAAAALAVPLLPGRRSPAHLALEIGHFWWRWLSVVPLFGVLLEPKGGSPHQGVHSIGFSMGGISRRGGARREGGAEDQW